jgi:tRNA(Ile)-lysidine synthase
LAKSTGPLPTVAALNAGRMRDAYNESILIERIARTIERYRMFQPGQPVGVAVSGGADSVCLLHVLLELAPRSGLRLSVLHLDHGLRGEESRDDAAFVRELAGRLGLPVWVREVQLAAAPDNPPDKPPDNLEQAARQARLAFFQERIASGAVERVALGHTRSDQAETVLFRFLRGSGTAGLAGIRPVTSDGLVRPLIGVDRADVTRFLRERAIPWREDSTNASPQFARNRLRHQLLPQLAREWNPAIGEMLAHTADWALAEEAYWQGEIDRLALEHLTAKGGAVFLRTCALQSLPLAAARRLVRRAMELAKGDLRGLGFEHIAGVLELALQTQGCGRTQAPQLDIRRSFDWLRFARARPEPPAEGSYQVPVTVPQTVRVPGTDLAISLELIEKAETSETPDCVYNSGVGCLDWKRLSGSLTLRNWRPGDQYQPVGSSGEEKIKTLFQHARIPIWERPGWPLLMDGSAVVWAWRFGPAAAVAAGPGSGILLRVILERAED